MSSAPLAALGVCLALLRCGSQPSEPVRDPAKEGPRRGPGYPASAVFESPARRPPAEVRAFEARSLLGPYRRLDEICTRPPEIALARVRCGAEVPSSAPGFEGATALGAPNDPFLEARLVAHNSYQQTQAAGHGVTEYHLGIRAREGWFFLPTIALTQEQPELDALHEWLVVAPMRVFRTRDGDPQLLELVYWEKMSAGERDSEERRGRSTKKIVLCGFASDGRPRCTAPTPVAEEKSVRRSSTGALLEQSRWELEVRYAPREVTVVLAPGSPDAVAPPSLLGIHPLDFDVAPASPESAPR